MHKYIRGTWLEIPAFFLFCIICLYAIFFAESIVQYFLSPFFGKWSILISFPIAWIYIYSPILDELGEHFKKYIS